MVIHSAVETFGSIRLENNKLAGVSYLAQPLQNRMKRSIRKISTSISLLGMILLGGGSERGTASAFSIQQHSLYHTSPLSTKQPTHPSIATSWPSSARRRSTAESSYVMPVRRNGQLHAMPSSSSSLSNTSTAKPSSSLPLSVVSTTNNQPSAVVSSTSSVVSKIWKSFESLPNISNKGNAKSFTKKPPPSRRPSSPGYEYFMALNDGDVDKALSFLVDTDTKNSDVDGDEDDDDDHDYNCPVEYEDTDFPNMWQGKGEVERNLRLLAQLPTNPIVIVDDVVYDPTLRREGIMFHLENPLNGAFLKKGAAFFELIERTSLSSASLSGPPLLIRKAFVVKENDKSGDVGLKILKAASDIISVASRNKNKESVPSNDKVEVSSSMSTKTPRTTTTAQPLPDNNPLLGWLTPSNQSTPNTSVLPSLTLPEQYFDSWNKREMERACSLFSDDIQYDDTAFPKPFTGKAALKRHLTICADSMPPTFSFVLDDLVNAGTKVMVKWHVENGSVELPFTRGCSCYEIDQGKITKGVDLKEPAVFKTAGVLLFVQSTISKLQEEPVRIIPLVLWVTYLYVVFFSDWFFGMPAQALETRTWEEVRDLALNFFLVSPILGLSFSPIVHPGLEGIFNLVLSWAALFAGFLSDDRPRKANLLPMTPIVVGMQFLTSAFLLPYLVTRSNETDRNVTLQQLNPITRRLSESKLLGVTMGFVGTGSVLWALFARTDDFGGIHERFSTLIDLLSIDRVGSSFLVDLALFGLFQGWLVDDDLQRRGMDTSAPIATIAKRAPFIGLALYLTVRSPLPEGDEESYSKQ
jgi:hypothetical protein